MARAKLKARFQPQQWIHDDAVDSAVSFRFDAARAFLSLGANQARRIASEIRGGIGGQDLDLLAEKADLVGEGADRHNGPFTVTVDVEDFEDFLRKMDLAAPTALDALTDDDMRALLKSHDALRVRISYEIVTPESAEHGDAAERGWEDEEGRVFDDLHGLMKFLVESGPLEASSSFYHPGLWYNGPTVEDRAHYESGEDKRLSYHVDGLSEAQGKAVFDYVKDETWPDLEILVGREVRLTASALVAKVVADASSVSVSIVEAQTELSKAIEGDDLTTILAAGHRFVDACRDDTHLSFPMAYKTEGWRLVELLDQAEEAGFELPEADEAPGLRR